MSCVRVVLAAIVLGLCLFMVACDGFFDYTVVNNTDQDLLVWAMTERCTKVTGKDGDYYHTETVPAGEALDYHETYGGGMDDPRCLQVATIDRHLIESVDVVAGEPGRLVVEEPITLGPFVPEERDLPNPSLASSAWELLNDFVRLVVIPLSVLFVLFATPVVIVFLLYRVGRAIYRRAAPR